MVDVGFPLIPLMERRDEGAQAPQGMGLGNPELEYIMGNSDITWSPLQTTVFETVLETVGARKEIKKKRGGKNAALLVRARAGTGKTTVILETILRLKRRYPELRILYTVFAKRNREEAEEKFARAGLGKISPARYKSQQGFQSVGPGCVDIKTINSLGYASLQSNWHRRVQTTEGNWTLRTWLDEVLPPVGREEGQMNVGDRKGILKLVEGAMAYLAYSDESLLRVAANEDLGIDYNREKWSDSMIFPIVRRTLDRMLDTSIPKIMFSHQIYTPARERFAYGGYDVVFVDEQQDQSVAKMSVTELALAPDGVMVAVGDPAQAIFGFAGADSESTNNFIAKWDPVILPLSITYRCPRLVVESVRTVVPDYQCGEKTPDGQIVDTDAVFMHENWKGGDVCLSRTNAPLIKHCLAAWRMGQKACVIGKDFAKTLRDMVKDAEKANCLTVPLFVAWVCEWEEREMERLQNLKRDTTNDREKVMDIAETLVALSEGLKTTAEILDRIERLFADRADPDAVIFSSTHRFKGGEAFRVWKFVDTYKPTGRTYREDESVGAEDCLDYVASTRVKIDPRRPLETGILFKVPVKNASKRQRRNTPAEAPSVVPATIPATILDEGDF